MSSANANGRPLAIVIWAIAITVVAFGLFRDWLPPLASDHGAGVDRMLHYTMIATGIMLLLANAALGYMLWRFGGRDRVTFRQATRRAERRGAILAAALIALVTEGGVLALGMPVWKQYFGTAPPADSLPIEVTTEQFAWNVRYPGPDGLFGRTTPTLITLDNPLGLDPADPQGKDDIVALNVLHAIAGRPVKIRLRSKDVLHSFFLPNLRVKQDSVPGMTVEFWFVPTRTGRFELACAQLCGFGHYEMRGILIVQTPEEFARWMQEQIHG